MKTAYLNPFGQSAYEIIYNYGNITQITQQTSEINNIILNTYNQEQKSVDTIKELCYEKIRQYYQEQVNRKNNNYNYLYTEAITTPDTIATHTLLQATAITYGHDSYEADMITNIITSTTQHRIEKTVDNELIDQTLSDYLDINNTTLNDIQPLINNDGLRLKDLILHGDKLIITYDDFLYNYNEYLKHRRAENVYALLTGNMKKNLLTALIKKQTTEYMKLIEDKQKQIEPAPIIQDIGDEIRKIGQNEKKNTIKQKYGGKEYTNYDDDMPTPYNTEAFPPCVKKALNGTRSGGRNYTITLFLTPFLSYARLYPGVYARHNKNPCITDNDPTLNTTREEILPLIYEAAQNCKPPLFKDQPQEKQNIHNKLGLNDKLNNTIDMPWYTPPNCDNIRQQQPELCTPCTDCQKIGNPLSYYNRKRKLLSRGEQK